ncbi:MAG: DUF2508 family protein [Clostridiaceae bacterium]|nr:DUF2508 family protein [Clostridiaceae bacterium]
MSEQAASRQKLDIISFIKNLGSSRAQMAERIRKEEYFNLVKESVQDAYMEWQNALANFENAEGKDMIDYYAYRIKASQIRYNYLLKKAKEAQNQ